MGKAPPSAPLHPVGAGNPTHEPVRFMREDMPSYSAELIPMPGDDASPVPESDAIRRFFVRPFFLSITIGIPFCAFKILFGLTAIRADSAVLTAFGSLVVAWAVADLLMNAGRSVLDLAGRPAPFEYCTIAQAGRVLGRPLVFLAIDTLLSFTIICVMLWSGWITLLSRGESYLWYGATTLNLISLSIVSLHNEIRNAGA